MTIKKEIKSLAFEVKEFIEEEDYFIFEGYASTFGNVDYGNDIIEKGAFQKSLEAMPEVPVLWQHKMHEPIGRSMAMQEDQRGLYVKARLPKADDLVKGRVMPQMKVGSIKEMSIGFFAMDYELRKDGVRIIKEIELFEFSLVTKAMNSQAVITNFKSIEQALKESGIEECKIEEVAKRLSEEKEEKEEEVDSVKDLVDMKSLEKSLKEKGYSNKEAKTIIAKAKEFSNQRDADEKQTQRDAEIKNMTEKLELVKSQIVNTLNQLKN